VRMPGKVPEKHVQVIFDVFSQNNSYRSSLFLFLMGVFCLFQLSSMNFELGLRSKRILVISFAQIPVGSNLPSKKLLISSHVACGCETLDERKLKPSAILSKEWELWTRTDHGCRREAGGGKSVTYISLRIRR